MGVVGSFPWQRVVKDVGEVVHVDASGGDVRGHQHLEVLLLETEHHPVALGLGHFSVKRVGAVASLQQVFCQRLRVAARPAKHHPVQVRIQIQEARDGLGFVRMTHQCELVVDVLVDRRRLVDFHLQRISHVLAHHAPNLTGHGRRE